MIYSPGKEFGEANLNFVVEDKRPYRFYLGADNTGIETMGRQRLMAGVTCGNFLGLDQLLTYQYTTAYHLNRFQAHTIQYVVPVPWRHLFNFFGGYSFVKPELGFPIESRKGHSGQISFRYVVPLGGPSRSVQEISCGFDYKNTNTTATFSELIANFGSSVNLSQFVLEYQWHREWSWSRLDVNLNGFYSPGSWLANETNEDYQSLREKAKNEWIYGKGSIRYLQRLGKDFNAILWLQGQYTSASLLPSEQFGIGGYATVRGYDERQLNMDDAFLASLEIRSPLIPLISMIRSKKIKDSLQFLAFVDYGWGRNRTLYEGEPNVAYLLGVGPGLRYTLDPSIAVRLDWGIKLEKKALYTGGNSEVHFSATISY
jgi:hemolysin activation/secretion protein